VITPSDVLVDANTTQTFVADVHNDATGAGVTWTISPDSGAGELTDSTATSVTYRAPASPPTGDLIVTITATSVAEEHATASATIIVSRIVVTLDPASETVEAGGSLALTASAQHDPSQAGVTWAITSPESGAGSLVDVTTTSATYQAPPSPPPEDLSVTITVTAVADGAASGLATITIPAIVVQIAPDSALIPANAVQAFQASVMHDPVGLGVAWTLTQAGVGCAPACGSLSNIDSASVTYTAPAELPANQTATITASSLSDATRSASVTIDLSSGTVQLVPAALNFHCVNKKGSKTLQTTLTNVGSTGLKITSIDIVGADRYSQSNNCGLSVSVGRSCRVGVTLSPKFRIGSFNAYLSITDSSIDSPQHIPLTGVGAIRCTETTAIKTALAKTTKLAAPVPTGPDSVGTRVIDLVDSARDDPFLRNGAKRELVVRFWYPAPVNGGCRVAPYAAPAVWRYLSEVVGLPPPAVRTNSCLDAPMKDGAHPVVVFSHGYTGMLTDYTFLFEDLASRGYVVASIGHTYESTAVSFPDGRLAKSVFGSHFTTARMSGSTFSLAESVRIADVRFVVDELGRLSGRHDSPFAGHLDTTSIAIAGHSLGGLTALQTMHSDSRIRAAVILDGIMADEEGGLTDTPVLILDAGRERWSADERQVWDRLRGPRFAINLKDAAHAAPSDLVWIAKGAVDTGSMTSEQVVAATRDYVAAFLDVSLQGTPVDPLLVRPSKRYPHVEVKAPNP